MMALLKYRLLETMLGVPDGFEEKDRLDGRAGRSTPIGSAAAPQESPSSWDNYFHFR